MLFSEEQLKTYTKPLSNSEKRNVKCNKNDSKIFRIFRI